MCRECGYRTPRPLGRCPECEAWSSFDEVRQGPPTPTTRAAASQNGARDVLLDKGFDPVFGARPMRRAIQNLIEDPLAEGLLHGRFQPGDVVLVDRQGDDLTLETKPGVAEPELEKVPAETTA